MPLLGKRAGLEEFNEGNDQAALDEHPAEQSFHKGGGRKVFGRRQLSDPYPLMFRECLDFSADHRKN